MGGMYFKESIEGERDQAKEKFWGLVEEAAWDHGHGGYTGTIAEKGGFYDITPFVLPDTTFDVIEGYFHSSEYGKPTPPIPSWWTGTQDQLDTAWYHWDDKWNDALAYHSYGWWTFFGWASS